MDPRRWWRRLRAAVGHEPEAPAPGTVLLADLKRYETLAEAAYEAMYEARHPHDCYEHASGYFLRAIATAQRLGRAADVARLTERKAQVHEVYARQFRGV